MQPEVITRTIQTPIGDADGKPISEGSVLREINDGTRGVITRIVRNGDREAPIPAMTGDILIKTGPGCYRVTNCYNRWRHIPHNEQTYEERYLSWLQLPADIDPESRIPEAEQIACQGIMTLLPDDIWNENQEEWPATIEVALRYLVRHLSIRKEPT